MCGRFITFSNYQKDACEKSLYEGTWRHIESHHYTRFYNVTIRAEQNFYSSSCGVSYSIANDKLLCEEWKLRRENFIGLKALESTLYCCFMPSFGFFFLIIQDTCEE